MAPADLRFQVDESLAENTKAGSPRNGSDEHSEEDGQDVPERTSQDGLEDGMNPDGFAGSPQQVVQPLTPEALAAFKAAQKKIGVIYISRIPPGMRPTKVRHIMSAYGEVGRVYLQQEDSKRAFLRRKYTSTKKPHFTEGWIEFKDKRVARSVAEMLNAQPIGGKKGTRWHDDVWTMKYLPKFKWNMLTEQIAHEAAVHAAQLRVELSQSRQEQREYLKNVELAHVLDKRAERKRKAGSEHEVASSTSIPRPPLEKGKDETSSTALAKPRKKQRYLQVEDSGIDTSNKQLNSVLNSIF